MEPATLYFTLMMSGFVLIGLEIFIPGGLLGVLGGLFWLAAAAVGWNGFPAPWKGVAVFAPLPMLILTFAVWMRFLPRSRAGRGITLNDSLNGSTSHRGTGIKVGALGRTASPLRPAGIADFSGRRTDVVSDSDWMETGETVRVVSVSGGRITVGGERLSGDPTASHRDAAEEEKKEDPTI